MIAVIFEVEPEDGARERYLEIAGELRPLLEQVVGFVSVERFESLSRPGKLLSLSFFEDEAAVARWRRLEAHRQAQADGRSTLFAGYRIRVAHVVRDYGLERREEAPCDSRALHA